MRSRNESGNKLLPVRREHQVEAGRGKVADMLACPGIPKVRVFAVAPSGEQAAIRRECSGSHTAVVRRHVIVLELACLQVPHPDPVSVADGDTLLVRPDRNLGDVEIAVAGQFRCFRPIARFPNVNEPRGRDKFLAIRCEPQFQQFLRIAFNLQAGNLLARGEVHDDQVRAGDGC